MPGVLAVTVSLVGSLGCCGIQGLLFVPSLSLFLLGRGGGSGRGLHQNTELRVSHGKVKGLICSSVMPIPHRPPGDCSWGLSYLPF